MEFFFQAKQRNIFQASHGNVFQASFGNIFQSSSSHDSTTLDTTVKLNKGESTQKFSQFIKSCPGSVTRSRGPGSLGQFSIFYVGFNSTIDPTQDFMTAVNAVKVHRKDEKLHRKALKLQRQQGETVKLRQRGIHSSELILQEAENISPGEVRPVTVFM